MKVIGIETSCDDTGMAAYDGNSATLHCSLIYTKENSHARFGGVVPEIASRDHSRILPSLFRKVLHQAQWHNADIDAVAYTRGPGLFGSLLVGAAFAKSLAASLSVPVIGIHHLEGHIVSPFLQSAPHFPFLALLVSGGHTQLYRINDWFDYQLLGASRDDAAGEAFDKCAKMLGLGYPGGKALSLHAQQGDSSVFALPRPMLHDGLDFSFSGLKTALLYTIRDLRKKNALTQQTTHDLAASVEQAIVDILVTKIQRARAHSGLEQVIVCGGVSANSALRKQLQSSNAIFPSLQLCTDNGAMIALAGYRRLHAGFCDTDWAIQPLPRWALGRQ